MKDLMKTNCYDIGEVMIITGSCLKSMQPKAYDELKKISGDIYDVCLESVHLNMVITKIIGMLCRVHVKKLIFASVDESPHCVQLHYIDYEVRKAMDLKEIEILHYVAVNNELIEIESDITRKSRALSVLQQEKASKEKERV